MTVLIGDPIHFDDLLSAEGARTEFTGKVYDAVASRIGHRLQELKVQVEYLALQHQIELQNYHGRSAERAAGILQQLDWESFGTGSFTSNDDEASAIREIKIQPKLNVNYHQQEQAVSSDRYFRVGLSHEGGITSRMRSFMDPAELMGFAARGLFMNCKTQNFSTTTPQEVGPLKAWKQFLEANVLRQWNYS